MRGNPLMIGFTGAVQQFGAGGEVTTSCNHTSVSGSYCGGRLCSVCALCCRWPSETCFQFCDVCDEKLLERSVSPLLPPPLASLSLPLPQVKTMASVLLRRVFLQLEYKELQEGIEDGVLRGCRAELLLAISAEPMPAIRRKIGDAVAEMARSSIGVCVCVCVCVCARAFCVLVIYLLPIPHLAELNEERFSVRKVEQRKERKTGRER